MLTTYFNPYSNNDFFTFFGTLVSRLFQNHSLVSDEIQILVLIGFAFSSALVGSFLVLKKMTMLANALSHTILLGIVLAVIGEKFVLNLEHFRLDLDITTMIVAALITGFFTTASTEILHKIFKLQEDASIGLVFTTLFALGIVLITLFTRNSHIGTEVVMGNVDALQIEDLGMVYWIAGLNLLIFIALFKEFKLVTFDSLFARSLGISPLIFSYLLMFQVSLTAIGGFRAVGVLMLLAFIVGPTLIAMQLTKSLKTLLFFSITIGVLVSLIGVALSRHILTVYAIPLSTGGIIVTLIFVLYLVTLCFNAVNIKIKQKKRVRTSLHISIG